MISKSPKPAPYQFHPLELSFIGYSGSGKTTLITRLLERLREDMSIAFVKHDAHRFEMDRTGKDTFRAHEAGAHSVFISDADHFATIGRGSIPLFQQRSMFLDADALIIEGHKALALDKIVVLDAEHSILASLKETDVSRIKAFVGAEAYPSQGLPWDKPYFQRDNSEGILAFVRGLWQSQVDRRPLRGLVLAGGESRRMGQDKGRLEYRGKPQAIHALELLESLGVEGHLSLRAGQWTDSDRKGLSIIEDSFLNQGPMSGLLSAMQSEPDAAWLVLACDLPLLRRETLSHLLQARNPYKMATAYRSTSDDLPEPLCAIYEPRIRMRMMESLALGLSCPRKVLLNTPSHILSPIDAQALTNVNTPEEFVRVQSQIQEHSL